MLCSATMDVTFFTKPTPLIMLVFSSVIIVLPGLVTMPFACGAFFVIFVHLNALSNVF
jgi:hypothetical protein